MPSSLVVAVLTAAAVLLPAAIIQGRSSRRASKPGPDRPLKPFQTGFAKGAYRTSPGMRPPALQHAARPRYPGEAIHGRPGLVEVLAVIDEEGDLTARVLAAPEPRDAFEREALACVGKYVFVPGAVEGTPVPVVVTLLVDFQPPGVPARSIRIVGGTADPPGDVDSQLAARAAIAGPVLLRPLPISKVYPDFEVESFPSGLAGRVEMLAVINADGTVGDVELTRPLAREVDDPAVAALRQWLFEPAVDKGRPVPVLVSAFISVNEAM